MKYANSWQTAPLINNRFSGKRQALEINLINYALSCLFLKRINRNIVLYTDELGKELFKEIPYDEICVLDLPKDIHWSFAASVKFEALKQMELGDVLIDGDLFIHKPMAAELIEKDKSDVLTSFFEDRYFLEKDAEVQTLMKKNLSEVDFDDPYKVEEFDDSTGWFNTSLIKINDQGLKDEWIRQYEVNARKIPNKFISTDYWIDIILEQENLGKLCQYFGYQPHTLIHGYNTLYGEKLTQNIGYCHLGGSKTEFHNTAKKLLENMDSEIYNNVMNSIDDKLKFVNAYGKCK